MAGTRVRRGRGKGRKGVVCLRVGAQCWNVVVHMNRRQACDLLEASSPAKPKRETFRRQCYMLEIKSQFLVLIASLMRGIMLSLAKLLTSWFPFPNLWYRLCDTMPWTLQGLCEHRLCYLTSKECKEAMFKSLTLLVRYRRPREVIPATRRQLSLEFSSSSNQAVFLLQRAECYAHEVDGYCSCQREHSRARWYFLISRNLVLEGAWNNTYFWN